MLWYGLTNKKQTGEKHMTTIRHKLTKDGFAVVTTEYKNNEFLAVFQVYMSYSDTDQLTIIKENVCNSEQRAIDLFHAYK